jgi:hypothetical protein
MLTGRLHAAPESYAAELAEYGKVVPKLQGEYRKAQVESLSPSSKKEAAALDAFAVALMGEPSLELQLAVRSIAREIRRRIPRSKNPLPPTSTSLKSRLRRTGQLARELRKEVICLQWESRRYPSLTRILYGPHGVLSASGFNRQGRFYNPLRPGAVAQVLDPDHLLDPLVSSDIVPPHVPRRARFEAPVATWQLDRLARNAAWTNPLRGSRDFGRGSILPGGSAISIRGLL